MLFLLLAFLPLDLAATATSARGQLWLEATLDGRRVGARLHNDTGAPIDVLLGYTCGGPQHFSAIVDQKTTSFATGTTVCSGNAMIIERLAPGAVRAVASQTLILDGEAHKLSVVYHIENTITPKGFWSGAIVSQEIDVPAAELALSLRAAVRGAIVEVEIDHLWRGTTRHRFLAGWGPLQAADVIFLDGKPTPLPWPSTPPEWRELGAGERFVSKRNVVLPRGVHRLRAVYSPEKRRYAEKGNIADWFGRAESPEIEVIVR